MAYRYSKIRNSYVGKTFPSNNYGDMLILDYLGKSKVKVRFLNIGCEKVVFTASLKSGNVRDDLVKKIAGERVSKYVGQTLLSVNSGEYLVVDHVKDKGFLIRFLATNNEYWVTVCTKTLTDKLVFEHTRNTKCRGRYSLAGGDKGQDWENTDVSSKCYKTWYTMLQRCAKGFGNYKDCTVSGGFNVYSNFKTWYDSQPLAYAEGTNLDKDILSERGSKTYSEDTCCVVPAEINMVLINRRASRGTLPIGVTFCKGSNKYKAQMSDDGSIRNLGLYPNPESAFLAYKMNKEGKIKHLAIKWADKLPERVFQRLMEWEVRVDD